MSAGTIVIAAIIVVIVLIIMMSIKLVPQGTAAVIERLGRYTKTVEGGITFLIPFVDRVRSRVDTRERVVSFPPQAVITQDNLTVAIDTVVTFQINDPMHSIYGVDNYLTGVEQTTTATLRDVVGGMTLEETLTSREVINRRLRGELDNATTKWGLRISRVELKAIDPPPSIQQSMEKQMKADREKRAMILTAEGKRESDIKTAEGEKQARILSAEGEKHAAILAAEAERQAMMLRAEGERAAKYLAAQGEARAIQKVNAAIKSSGVTPELLAYQYLEQLPKIANNDAATMWMIPSQFGDSLQQFARAFANKDDDGVFRYESESPNDRDREMAQADNTDRWFDTSTDPELAKALAEARAVANKHVDDPDPTQDAAQGSAQDSIKPEPSGATRREITAGEPERTGFEQDFGRDTDVSEPVSRPVTRPDQQPE